MWRQGWLGCRFRAACWYMLSTFAALVATTAFAEAPSGSDFGLSPRPTPLQDDAQLHDVQFVGSRLGWAVGDHGVIWHTQDGGEIWELQKSGCTCPLRSVCFLTDKLGWIAGGGTMPFTHFSYGVLLQTNDGGQTWRPLLGSPLVTAEQSQSKPAQGTGTDEPKALPTLPRLARVKFFSKQEGFVVGAGSDNEPSGVYFTEDAGASWHALPGKATPGWQGADFVNLEQGVVVGPRGQIRLVTADRVVSPRVGSLGLKGLFDVCLATDRTGWLVGDGGLLLYTTTAGLAWSAPPADLPEGIRDVFDFRVVSTRGDHVWVAGDPGSVVWHSADRGKSWEPQSTGETVPIHALHFGNETRGCAVGPLGLILRTDDGGASWHAARGGGRRIALMLLQGQNRQISLAPVVDQSGEAGYRSLVSVLASDELVVPTAETADFPERLSEAMSLAGGSGSHVAWQLPVGIPGLDRHPERLIAEWNRRTENRLNEILTGMIVRQLRTWRPSVLVLEEPAEHDALTRLINEAALRALDQSRDATSFPAQHELALLSPWEVSKVYAHLPPGSTGHAHVEPHQYLPHLRQTVRMAAGAAEGILFTRTAVDSKREAYRLIRSRWDEKTAATMAGGFFGGISIPSSSDARRELVPIDDDEAAARIKLAQKQRNFAVYAERSLGDSRHAGQIIAQIPDIVRGVPPAQAAMQLAELAERYQSVGQWELSELTLLELAERFPDEPVALRGMQTLIQYWSSSEITWRRLRPQSSEQKKGTTDPTQTAEAILRAAARLDQQAQELELTIFNDDGSTKGTIVEDVPQRREQRSAQMVHKDLDKQVRFWQGHAVRMAKRLEGRAPKLAAAPEVQFPLAAVFRQRALYERSDEVYRKFLQRELGTPWTQPAQGEFWLSRPVSPLEGLHTNCVHTQRRPALDGVLSDSCWQESEEIRLGGADRTTGEDRRPLLMLCYDEQYLYVGASIPRAPGVRDTPPSKTGRNYDEDLTDYDRLTFYFDVDRDRATWYSLSIDQRGKTAEACWNDASWNPRKCFVAVDAEASHWRLEMAIPFEELAPVPPQRGGAWALGIVRTIPAVGWESWMQPFDGVPRPEAFGLVRFD